MIARPGEKYFAARTWPFSHHRLSKLGYIFFFLVSLLSFLLDVVQPCNRYWLVRGRPQLKMFLSKLNGTAIEPSHPYSSQLLRPATETINLHNIGPAPDSFQARLLGDITKTKETNSCCIPPCTRRNNDGSKKKTIYSDVINEEKAQERERERLGNMSLASLSKIPRPL